MMSSYPNVEREHLVPSEHGIRKLGHTGYFRKTAAVLWPIAGDWLDRRG
jgi:predicted alpha/beta hydrolase